MIDKMAVKRDYITEKMMIDDANVRVSGERIVRTKAVQKTTLRTLSFSMSLGADGATRVLKDVTPAIEGLGEERGCHGNGDTARCRWYL